PNPAKRHAERGQKSDDIGRLSWHLLFQDHLAGITDNAHRRFFHRHIKTHEMRHLIAPSDARARTDLDPCIVTEGDAPSASKAEPQPPRYNIFRSGHRTFSLGGGNQ